MGHLALGYVIGKASAKFLKTEVSLPLIFTLSVLPDIDTLFPFLIQHRGLTHSIIFAFIVFLSSFAVYRKKVVPYFAAFVQHFLIGDYVAGGAQILWPITSRCYGINMCMRSLANITLEWTLFFLSIAIMLKAGDLTIFFKTHNSNMLLAIPTFTVLLPTLTGFPSDVPILLIFPHLFYLCMFSASTIIQALKMLTENSQESPS